MKSLALISGKGGSGKTTIGLSIASLLSQCEIRIMLIDCDLNTNGATYFFEDMLNEYQHVTTFTELIENGFSDSKQIMQINDNFSFIPSIKRITKENSASYKYNSNDQIYIDQLQMYCQNNYDVVIYDCQSGYTDVLSLILPKTDVNLVVMEADKISTAALRSLYIKINSLIGHSKVFQIFNKVTVDDKDYYSKLIFGTMFINVGAILFDGSIRRAFAVSKLPEVEGEGAIFGTQVCELCLAIINDSLIRQRIEMYLLKLRMYNKEQEINLTIKSIEDNNNQIDISDRNKKIMKMMTTSSFMVSVIALVASFCTVFFSMREVRVWESSATVILSMLIMTFFAVFVTFFLQETKKEKRERKIKYSTEEVNQHKIQVLKKEYRDLEIQLSEMQNNLKK